MIRSTLFFLAPVLILLIAGCKTQQAKSKTHEELVKLFEEWREFVVPPLKDGIPDYSTSAMREHHYGLNEFRKRLNLFDTTGWPVKHQVDMYLVWAEMNGFDFEHRVMRPWDRDPAFYVWFYTSMPDVPEREGPNISGAIELPAYRWPLSANDAAEIASRLRKVPQLYQQAKDNLFGTTERDLWITGTRSIEEQSEELRNFAQAVAATHADLSAAAEEAAKSSDEFAAWLTSELPRIRGFSGIGENNYSWYVRNVHLSPYTWEDETVLLERELGRAHSALRFAEYRNKQLPKLSKVTDSVQYRKMLNDGVTDFLSFLEKENVMTVKSYWDSAMRAQIKGYVDTQTLRGFFDEIDYRDPMPMRAHHFHWIDKAREALEPNESPIRRVPLMYNIFDSRAEGIATAMEEIVLNAGMLENRPRAKELVYIMLAQRAARGLGGLYQHSNDMKFDEATKFASQWVPWGLLPADGSTIQHEEQFYLQQPGYGSSYVIGKIDFDRLIAEYAEQRGEKFELKQFMDEFTKCGIIPMSLIYWEMTGKRTLLDEALKGQSRQ